MRNLKRVLSLALALVMVLGMMVIGTSAATFDDADEITYTEAVEVMAALGVLAGDGTGNFNPKGDLNRAGAAKLIAFMTMGADADDYLTGSAATFTDVAADHWAAKYVAYCSNLGIINGNGDGTFNPDGKISVVGFAKLVLGAIEAEGTFTGAGWEDAVKKAYNDVPELKATGIKITTANITREEAAALMLAGMKAGEAYSNGYYIEGKEALGYSETYADAYIMAIAMKIADPVILKHSDKHNSLLKDVYGVKYIENDVDAYGRPGVGYEKEVNGEKVIDLYFQNEAAAKYVNTFSKKVVEDMNKAAKKDLFAGATIVYNGADALALTDLYTPKGGSVNGLTVELYNTDTDAEIEKIIVIESNFATVKEVKATEGEKAGSVTITVACYDGSGKPANVDVKFEDNLKSTTDNYDVLAGYAKDTALSVTLQSPWETSDLLAVEELTAVEGKVTKMVTGDYTCTSKVTVAGTEYGMNNLFVEGKAKLAIAAEGTLYLDAQGNALAWATKKDADKQTNTVYFVCGYVINVPTSYDEYGQEVAGGPTYWAQYVTMTGETVIAQTKIDTSKWTPGLVEVSTAYDATDKIDYTVFDAAKDVKKNAAEVKATDIKIADGEYFTDDVKFIFVDGAKDKLKVEVKEGVQAIAKETALYIPAEIKGDTNKTVSVVIVAGKVETAPVVAEGVTFGAEGAASTAAVLYTDKDGKDAIGYEHTVYVDGVKTTIVTDSNAAVSGFVTLTEVVTGVYKVAAVDLSKATNLLDAAKVTNMYKGLLSTKDGVTDMAVAGAALVDVSGDEDVTDDATKLTNEYTVALVLSADKKSIVTIYVTDFTPAE